MTIAPLLFLVAVTADNHLEVNPLYRQLVEEGVTVGGVKKIPMPAPVMPDGLSANEQKAVIEELGGRRYPYSRLIRDSAVAPQILKTTEIEVPNFDGRAQQIDVYFIAYGNLDKIVAQGDLADPSAEDPKWKMLTDAELQQRGIEPPANERESFGHISEEVLNRVQVGVAMHLLWSRTPDSILLAQYLDPRFHGDAKYPNQWQPLERSAAGTQELGEKRPYEGVGSYFKITRLEEPKGALFIESHTVFAEPQGWFDGKNLLGAKLPPIVQTEVRTARRKLSK